MTTDESAQPRKERRHRAWLVAFAVVVVAWFLFEVAALFPTETERYIVRIERAQGCSSVSSITEEPRNDAELVDGWDEIEAAANAREFELGCLGLEL